MRKVFFDRTAAVLLLVPAIILSATSTINFSTTRQVIDGFGGSSAWCPAYNAATADALFGNAANQVGFTILRLRIDPHGSWATEKTNATMAKARGATVFATPWSPPESLKTNNNVVKGYIITSKFASFANWMKSFWTYCGSANVDIMSLENEPDYAQSITYEGCGWSATDFMNFCRTYAPAIGKPIMMPESFQYRFPLSDSTLNDAAAAANVTYIGGHLYGVQPSTYTLALNKGKHVWETEHYYDNDNASVCMTVAKEVFDCMNCSFSAYVWWWMTYNNNATALLVNGSLTHRAWVIGQFSKWVRPGYVRVDATYNPQTGVYAVAFKGDRYVIVAMNNTTSAQSVTFACSNATIPSVIKYTSSQTKSGANDGTITATGNSFSTTLDAQCVSTFVSTNTVSVLPPESWRLVLDKSRSMTGPSNFIYLVNGKRLNLPAMNGQGILTPGIYILNGNARVSVGAEKTLHASRN
jgi:glucuronoarabinoxylan endo-1,4-beta-xylanase